MEQEVKRFELWIFLTLIIGVISVFSIISIVSASTANTTINSTLSSLISIASTGTVTLNVLPSGSGSQTIGSDTVTVNTNNSTGYTLSIASSSGSNSLISGANSIPASSGTQASPVVQAANTWGYCVSGVGGFGATCPSVTASNQAIGSNKFAGVPVSGSPNTIITTSVPAVNATTTVWYAVAANTSQSTGTYSGSVTYTATAN